MENFQIETIGEIEYLYYYVAENEKISRLAYGMLQNNSIEGILKPQLHMENGKKTLQYCLKGLRSLNKYLESNTERQMVLGLLKKILSIIYNASDYMLYEKIFVFDMEYIYINEKNDILLVPVPTDKETENNLKKFCNLIIQMPEVTQNVLHQQYFQLESYLKEETFDIREFLLLIETVELSYAIQSAEAGGQRDRVVLSKKDRITKEEGKEPIVLKKKVPESDVVLLCHHNTEDSNCFEKTSYMAFPVNESEDEVTVYLDCSTVAAELVRTNTNERISINHNIFRIGKSREGNEYCVLGNPAISRHHATIYKIDTNFFIEDNNSKNHTYIGQHKLSTNKKMILQDGMKIKLADEIFIFNIIKS